MLHKYEGMKIKLVRHGEAVQGVLVGSKFGSHYNAGWANSDGQEYVGKVSEAELEDWISKSELR
ncbi:unnamed protein product [marine sediment metagenome]|uniref:Uncharacterized protein n=1 Tax=marine sediment metagenome TaxID=412755 RepID=X1EMJ1_9ZZZZ